MWQHFTVCGASVGATNHYRRVRKPRQAHFMRTGNKSALLRTRTMTRGPLRQRQTRNIAVGKSITPRRVLLANIIVPVHLRVALQRETAKNGVEYGFTNHVILANNVNVSGYTCGEQNDEPTLVIIKLRQAGGTTRICVRTSCKVPADVMWRFSLRDVLATRRVSSEHTF